MTDRDDLLRDALAHDRHWDDVDLERLRAADPAAARELEALLEVEGRLEAAATDPEALDEASGDRELVADVVERLRRGELGDRAPAGDGVPRVEATGGAPPAATAPVVDQTPGAQAPAWWKGWLRVAAAALLVVAVSGLWKGDDPPPRPRDVPLGVDPRLEPVAPLGEVDDFHEFRVESRLADLDHIELSIWDAAGVPGAGPIEQRVLAGTAWAPTAEERRALPDALRWRITAYAGDGRRLATAEGAALRRDP